MRTHLWLLGSWCMVLLWGATTRDHSCMSEPHRTSIILSGALRGTLEHMGKKLIILIMELIISSYCGLGSQVALKISK